MDIAYAFRERADEIDEYLRLLSAFEKETQSGPPKIGGETVTSRQQKILYSALYLQLYNLVEATVTWCIDAVCDACADGGRWHPKDLSSEIKKEWVRFTARTHIELNANNRLDAAVAMCDRLIQALPVSEWEIARGGGGNWDDTELEDFAVRIGLPFQVSESAKRGVKRFIRQDQGALGLVKKLRNDLTHGSISFSECGDGVTVSDLIEIKDRTATYLLEVIRLFHEFVDGHCFLLPERRPVEGAAK